MIKLLSGLLSRAGSVRQWHWISSAICLVGILGFSITGITLNHAGSIEAKPRTRTVEAALPEGLLQRYDQDVVDGEPLPPQWRSWLRNNIAVQVAGNPAELSEDEVYVGLPQPGGDAWLALDLMTGEVFYEHTDRGWVSYFNDLHKGRYTGAVWFWFIDIFAAACVIFSMTGFWLLWRHAGSRPSTWPMVGLGLLAPLLIMLLFIH